MYGIYYWHKLRLPAAAALSVWFARGVKATEFSLYIVHALSIVLVGWLRNCPLYLPVPT